MVQQDRELYVPSSFRDKLADDAEVVDWNKRAQAFLRLYGKQHARDVAGIASVAQLSDEETWLHEDPRLLARGEFPQL